MIRTLAAVCVLIRRCFNLPHSRFHLAFLLSYSILCFATFGSCGKCWPKYVTCDVACAYINGFNSDICEHTQDNHLVYELIIKHIYGNSSTICFDSTFPEGIIHEQRPNVALSRFTIRTFSLKHEDIHNDKQYYIGPLAPSDKWPDPFTREDSNMLNFRNSDVLPYSAEKNLNTNLKTNFPGFHTGLYFHFPYGCNHSMPYDPKSLSTDMRFISTKFYPVIDEVDEVFSFLLNGLFGNLSVFYSLASQPPCEIQHLLGTPPADVFFDKISYFNSGSCRVVDYYDLWGFSESHLKEWLDINCGNVVYFLGNEIRSHGKVYNSPENSERVAKIELNYGSSVVFLDMGILREESEAFKRLFKPPGLKLFLGQQHKNFISFLVMPLVYSLVEDFELAKSWTLYHPSYEEGFIPKRTRLDDSVSRGKWHSISCIQFSSKESKGVEVFEMVMKSGMAEEEDDPPNLTRVSPTRSFRKEDDLGGYVDQFVNKNKLPILGIQWSVFGPEESKRPSVSYPYAFCEEFPEISVTTTRTMVIIPLKFRNPVPKCSQQGRPSAWVRSIRPFVAAFLLFSFLFLAFYSFSPQPTAASPLKYESFFSAENRDNPQAGETFSVTRSPSENRPLENRGPKTGFPTIVSPPKPVKVPDPQVPLQHIGSATRATKEMKKHRRKRKGGGESIKAEIGGSQSGNSTPSSPSSPVSYENFGRSEAAVPAHHPPVTQQKDSVFSFSPPSTPSRSPLPPYDRAPGPKNYSRGLKWEAAGKKELVYDIWGDHLCLCNVVRGSVDGTEEGSESFFTCGPHVLVKGICGNGEK